MRLRNPFARRRPELDAEAEISLRDAEYAVDRFALALDEVMRRHERLGDRGGHDDLHDLIAHRVNWGIRMEDNIGLARQAFESGRRNDAVEYLRRATTKAEEGMVDLERAMKDERLR